MKKLIYLFSAIVLIFTSCSSDDIPLSAPQTPILVTKITTTNQWGTHEQMFEYNGNKIVKKTISDEGYEMYFYTDDLITKIERFDDNSVHTSDDVFEYNSAGNLIVFNRISYLTTIPNVTKQDYIYNSDNTISWDEYYGDLSAQNSYIYSGKYYLNANNEVEKLDLYLSGGDVDESLITHDSYNSPFKNILGYNKLFPKHYASGSTNNVLSFLGYYNDDLYYGSNFSQYAYNSSNFPTSYFIENIDGFFTENVELFYN